METNRPRNSEKLIPAIKIQGIFNLAFKIQTKGIANVFIDFQAHVSQINIRIYKGGWNTGLEPEYYSLNVSQTRFSKDHYSSIIDDLTELYNSEVSYEEIQEKRRLREIEIKRQQYEKLKAEFEPES